MKLGIVVVNVVATLVLATHISAVAVMLTENERAPQEIAKTMAAPLDTYLK